MTAQLASIIFDSPPASISSSTLRSPPSGKHTSASALIGRPPMAYTSLSALVAAICPKTYGIVNDGREEIDRLDERQLRRELIHAGVVGCVEADEHVGIVLPG